MIADSQWLRALFLKLDCLLFLRKIICTHQGPLETAMTLLSCIKVIAVPQGMWNIINMMTKAVVLC